MQSCMLSSCLAQIIFLDWFTFWLLFIFLLMWLMKMWRVRMRNLSQLAPASTNSSLVLMPSFSSILLVMGVDCVRFIIMDYELTFFLLELWSDILVNWINEFIKIFSHKKTFTMYGWRESGLMDGNCALLFLTRQSLLFINFLLFVSI